MGLSKIKKEVDNLNNKGLTDEELKLIVQFVKLIGGK